MSLEARIRARILQDGPMGVAEYMALCLLDPADGYYTRREAFGAAGDFITAPEVSQMFGELLGAWVRAVWQAAGAPEGAVLAELGPGRGTLMRDMLRALGSIDPRWLAASRICLVEASPRLRAEQRAMLGGNAVEWFERIEDLPEGPLFVVANEFLDALPVRQFVKTRTGWRERVIGLNADDALGFLAGPGGIDPAWLPQGAGQAAVGTVFEASPAREAAMALLAHRVARTNGAILLIDYGHLAPGFGDTLQAVRAHRFAPVLEAPGHADLTTHVDFASLARIARSAGLDAGTATQGDFLLALGLLERAGVLGGRADEAGRERLRGEVERLAGPAAMGHLFKVLGVARPGLALPGLEPHD